MHCLMELLTDKLCVETATVAQHTTSISRMIIIRYKTCRGLKAQLN